MDPYLGFGVLSFISKKIDKHFLCEISQLGVSQFFAHFWPKQSMHALMTAVVSCSNMILRKVLFEFSR